jgi:pimeloyl-ACP methyl ester carboxylesterase
MAYKTVKVGDLDIFYREAGPKDAPTILLLHGFPTSSQMFRNLIPALADQYHLVAPDYPGYGHSSMPPRDRFSYTFDNLAKVIDELTTKSSSICFLATAAIRRCIPSGSTTSVSANRRC